MRLFSIGTPFEYKCGIYGTLPVFFVRSKNFGLVFCVCVCVLMFNEEICSNRKQDKVATSSVWYRCFGVCVLLCYGEWELRNIEITGNQKKIKHFVSGTTKDND